MKLSLLWVQSARHAPEGHVRSGDERAVEGTCSEVWRASHCAGLPVEAAPHRSSLQRVALLYGAPLFFMHRSSL